MIYLDKKQLKNILVHLIDYINYHKNKQKDHIENYANI